MDYSAIRSIINGIDEHSDISPIFEMLNDRIKNIHRKAAVHFRLGQVVDFYEDGKNMGRYKGTVDNINRDGKVKVKLVNSRYAAYTMGAQDLLRGIERMKAMTPIEN